VLILTAANKVVRVTNVYVPPGRISNSILLLPPFTMPVCWAIPVAAGVNFFCLDAKGDCSDLDSVPDSLNNCRAADHQTVIQERAWTSPIWYTP
jgi:hypothetical protein